MEFVVSIIVWTLALYGLFEIIKNIVYICTYTKLNTDGIYFLVVVKNQEENIEGFLRNLLFRIIYGKEEVKNITLLPPEVKEMLVKDIEAGIFDKYFK